MTPERWQQVVALVEQALSHPEAGRAAWVADQCRDDDGLAAEVLSLLSHAPSEGDLLDQPLVPRLSATALAASAIDPHAEGDETRVPAGTRLGPFRIDRFLARGGMGSVYLGVRDDGAFDQQVAIKVMSHGRLDPAAARRFLDERRILATLDHPYIARIIDGSSTPDGRPYLVMEYVDGNPIDGYCRMHALTIEDRLRLFLRVCEAVQDAHRRLVVHRDLKPANILVREDGTPRLLDFGIAKLTTPDGQPPGAGGDVSPSTMALMTPEYAAPEQVTGGPITTATDVHALGLLLYELLSDRRAFAAEGRSAFTLGRIIAETDPPPPSAAVDPTDARRQRRVRGELDAITLKALRKEPASRYTSVEQFADDIRRHLAREPVSAVRGGRRYQLSRFLTRRWKEVSAVGLILASLVTGLVLTMRAQNRADRRFRDVQEIAHQVIFDYHDAIAGLPGSTPVRERLVRDALAYLDRLAIDADTVALRRDLVDAYTRVSAVQGNSYYANLGDTAGASATAERAVTIATALIASDSSPDSTRAAARAFENLADVQYTAGSLRAADTAYQRAQALINEESARGPLDRELQRARIDVTRKLADLYGGSGIQGLGRTKDAAALHRQAAGWARELAAGLPHDEGVQRLRFMTLVGLGAIEQQLGNRQVSLQTYQDALRLADAAVAQRPDNQLDAQELANIALRVALVLLDDGRAGEAEPLAQRSVDVMGRLAAQDPENVRNRRNLAVVLGQLGRIQLEAGRVAAALPNLERALQIAIALRAADSASVELALDVAISERRLGDGLVAAKRHPEAAAHLSSSVRKLDELAAGSADAFVRLNLARSLLSRAAAAVARHDASADTDLDRAQAVLEVLQKEDPANSSIAAELARAVRLRTR